MVKDRKEIIDEINFILDNSDTITKDEKVKILNCFNKLAYNKSTRFSISIPKYTKNILDVLSKNFSLSRSHIILNVLVASLKNDLSLKLFYDIKRSNLDNKSINQLSNAIRIANNDKTRISISIPENEKKIVKSYIDLYDSKDINFSSLITITTIHSLLLYVFFDNTGFDDDLYQYLSLGNDFPNSGYKLIFRDGKCQVSKKSTGNDNPTFWNVLHGNNDISEWLLESGGYEIMLKYYLDNANIFTNVLQQNIK